jgi:hypothetical protein
MRKTSDGVSVFSGQMDGIRGGWNGPAALKARTNFERKMLMANKGLFASAVAKLFPATDALMLTAPNTSWPSLL